jgi:hypothetical protein
MHALLIHVLLRNILILCGIALRLKSMLESYSAVVFHAKHDLQSGLWHVIYCGSWLMALRSCPNPGTCKETTSCWFAFMVVFYNICIYYLACSHIAPSSSLSLSVLITAKYSSVSCSCEKVHSPSMSCHGTTVRHRTLKRV